MYLSRTWHACRNTSVVCREIKDKKPKNPPQLRIVTQPGHGSARHVLSHMSSDLSGIHK